MEDPDAGVQRMIEQWNREMPGVDALPMALFGRLTRADTLAGAAIAATLRAHGLNRGEFDVLATLYRSGVPEGLSAGALSSSMLLSPAATTNRVDRLESAGLLIRAPDPSDGRGVRVQLTPRGASSSAARWATTSAAWNGCSPACRRPNASSSPACWRGCSTASPPGPVKKARRCRPRRDHDPARP